MTIKIAVKHLIIVAFIIVILVVLLISVPIYQSVQENKQVDIIQKATSLQGATLLNSHKVKNVYLIDWQKADIVGSAIYLDGVIISVGSSAQTPLPKKTP